MYWKYWSGYHSNNACIIRLASRDLTHEQPESSMFDHRVFGSGTHGNNTPPRYPHPSSPPPRRPPSHHEEENNDEISPEALMRFEQDEEAQRMMRALLE